MALAKKCDRCGKLHPHYETADSTWGNGLQIKKASQIGETQGIGAQFDLCYECMEELAVFLNIKNEPI